MYLNILHRNAGIWGVNVKPLTDTWNIHPDPFPLSSFLSSRWLTEGYCALPHSKSYSYLFALCSTRTHKNIAFHNVENIHILAPRSSLFRLLFVKVFAFVKGPYNRASNGACAGALCPFNSTGKMVSATKKKTNEHSKCRSFHCGKYAEPNGAHTQCQMVASS